MNYSNFRISLDIHETSSQTIIKMKKGDTGRRIMIALRENSNAYQIEEGCTAVFTAVKPDGNLIYNECAISDNVIIYTITEQTANVLGSVNCEIKLYDRDGVLITSPSFIVYVLDPVFFWGDLPESAPEYTAFRAIAAQFAVSDEHIIELIEANSEVFVAQYGVTTLDEIQTAAEGDLACFAKNNESHHILPLVSVAKDRMAEFSGIVSGTLRWVRVTSDGWTSGSESYEKTNTLDEKSTDDQIPTAKAVYDLVAENKCVFIAEYGVTTASEVREALRAGKACFAKKEIYYIPLLEADGYFFEFSGFYETMNYHYSLSTMGWEDNSTPLKETTMLVHITSGNGGAAVTADKTYAEIKAAHDAGKLIEADCNGTRYAFSVSGDPSKELFFKPIYSYNNMTETAANFVLNKSNVWSVSNVNMPTDKHIIKLIQENAPEGITEEEVNDLISAKVAGVLTVNFSIGGPATPASADKTYAEIKEALNSGNTVEGRYNGKSFVYAGTNRSGDISFKQPVYMNDLASVDPQNYGYLITIKSDNNVTFETILPWGAAQELVDGIPQADWNQSDSEAKDYVKNRPFYEALEETTVTREFDGKAKLFDSEFCELLFEKRAEAVHIVEGIVFSYVGNDSEWNGGWSYKISDGVSTYYVIAMKESGSGVYGLVMMTEGGTYKPGSISVTVEAMAVHKLDEKYIPDTIARKEDIPSVPASPVVWVKAVYDGTGVDGSGITADTNFNEIMTSFFADKVIMCQLEDPLSRERWLLVCIGYNSDDAIFGFEAIRTGNLDGTLPGLACTPDGWSLE